LHKIKHNIYKNSSVVASNENQTNDLSKMRNILSHAARNPGVIQASKKKSSQKAFSEVDPCCLSLGPHSSALTSFPSILTM
jgi:hypothetical protein